MSLRDTLKTEKAKERYDKNFNSVETTFSQKELELHDKEIRAKAIDEFAEKLKREILEEIDDASNRQKNYEVGSDMSTTYSHIMGTLRDVYHRIIDKIAEELKAGEKNG